METNTYASIMRQLGCCIIVIILFLGTNFAQNGENPFELQGREKNASVPAKENSSSEVSDNPFELHQNRFRNKKQISGKKTKIKQKASLKSDNNFLFGIIAFMVILLTFLVSLYRSLIQKIYRAFLNDNFLKMIHREQGSIVSFPYLLLYLMFFLNGGIFIFLLLRFYGQLNANLFQILSQCIAGLIIIFLLKHLVLKVIANIFPVAKEIKQYSFMIIIFSIIIGFLLVPINVMLAYLPTVAIEWVIYLSFVLIVLIYLFRSLRGIFLSSKYVSLYKFHFFMYLCTVEIAPVLILIKLAGIR